MWYIYGKGNPLLNGRLVIRWSTLLKIWKELSPSFIGPKPTSKLKRTSGWRKRRIRNKHGVSCGNCCNRKRRVHEMNHFPKILNVTNIVELRSAVFCRNNASYEITKALERTTTRPLRTITKKDTRKHYKLRNGSETCAESSLYHGMVFPERFCRFLTSICCS